MDATGPKNVIMRYHIRSLLNTVFAYCSVLLTSTATLRGQLPPLVDHHQHLFSPASAALSPGLRPISADDLVHMLDQAKIHRAVVLSVAYQFGNPNRPPVEDEYGKVKAENDWTSQQVARYPDRLRGFCGVNPMKDYALEEIARCAKNPQLRFGVKLHFGNSDVDLDNPRHVARIREVFQTANSNRMAIAVHMRPTLSRQRPYGTNQARVFLEEVLPAAPDVPVQIAHLAGAGGYDDPAIDQAIGVFADAIAKNDRRMSRVYFDVSGIAGPGNWVDKGPAIAIRIRQLGLQRVLYGSDGAVTESSRPREAWAAFRRLPLSEGELESIARNEAPYMR